MVEYQPLTKETAQILKPYSPYVDERLHLVEMSDDGRKFKIRLYRSGDENKGYRYPLGRTSRFIQRFPESQRLGVSSERGETWYLGAVDSTVAIIDSAWPKDQLLVSAECGPHMQGLRLQYMRQTIAARMLADWKNNQTVPTLPDVNEHPDFPLEPYQKVFTQASLHNPGFARLMQQGTGKTYCSIARIMTEAAKRKNKAIPYRAIIVCPKAVRLNWEQEIIRFATLPGRVTRLRGNPVERFQCVIDALKPPQNGEQLDYTILICNYETLSSSWEQIRACMEFDLAVLDESHNIKNEKAKRTEYALKLRDMSKQREVLTGTAIANTLLDLYTQLEFCGQGFSGFTSFGAFKRFYGVYESTASGIDALVGFQNIPFIQERLARCACVITLREALPYLPKKLYDVVETSLSKEQRDCYMQLLEGVQVELDGMDHAAFEVNNILTRLLRLAQITAGHLVIEPVYNEDGAKIREGRIDRFDPNPRMEDLISELNEHPSNEKVIIWSCFVESIRQIRARIALEFGPDSVVSYYGGTKDTDREKAKDAFNNNPKCRFFVGNPAAGGTGLTLLGYNYKDPEPQHLDTNCTRVIYYSQNWNSVHRSQSEFRPFRRGTRVPVRISTMAVEHSIDVEIHSRVSAKIEAAKKITSVGEVLALIDSIKLLKE